MFMETFFSVMHGNAISSRIVCAPLLQKHDTLLSVLVTANLLFDSQWFLGFDLQQYVQFKSNQIYI